MQSDNEIHQQHWVMSNSNSTLTLHCLEVNVINDIGSRLPGNSGTFRILTNPSLSQVTRSSVGTTQSGPSPSIFVTFCNFQSLKFTIFESFTLLGSNISFVVVHLCNTYRTAHGLAIHLS